MINYDYLQGDLLNACFQGYFDSQSLQRGEGLRGSGAAFDDELNLLVGEWKYSKLDGPGTVRLSNGMIVYGQFGRQRPSSTFAIKQGKYKLFLQKRKQSSLRRQQCWQKDAVLIDGQSKLFYILELTLKDPQSQMELDRTQKIGSMNRQSVQSSWKVRIVDRCTLNSEGKLLGYSKMFKNMQKRHNLTYNRTNYSIEHQNHIHLIATVLGQHFTQPQLISLSTFLKDLSQHNTFTQLKELREGNQDLMLFSIRGDTRQGNMNTNLGLLYHINSNQVKSVGYHSREGRLNGLAIQYTKRNQTFAGIFKQNLMLKQYSHISNLSSSISTVQLKQLLRHQHLQSNNYHHDCLYLPQLNQITNISNKIIKYTCTFEKQFEKRHLSYHDSQVYISTSMDGLDSGKYKGSEQVVMSQEQEEGSRTRYNKKAGFIVNTRNQKSISPGVVRISPSNRSPRKIGRITNRISSHKTNNNHGKEGSFAPKRPIY